MPLTPFGQEELARVKRTILTREETRRQVEDLFNTPDKYRQADRDLIEKLFVQAPAANVMAYTLQKEKIAAAQTGNMEKVAELEKREKAKNVCEFFEKKAFLTDAQRRFPELLKVSKSAEPNPSVDLKKRDESRRLPSKPTTTLG